MANTSLGGGLVSDDSVGGRYPRRRHGTPYFCSQAADIGVGDCVTINGTSNTSEITPSSGKAGGVTRYKPGTLRAVVRSTNGDGNPITGVVLSVDHQPTVAFSSSAAYHVSGGADVLYVDDDPMSTFEIEVNGSIAVTDVGSNINLDTGATVSAHSGRSNLKALASSIGADATKQLTILGVSKNMNRNDLGSAGPSIYVRINNHTEASNKAGV